MAVSMRRAGRRVSAWLSLVLDRLLLGLEQAALLSVWEDPSGAWWAGDTWHHQGARLGEGAERGRPGTTWGVGTTPSEASPLGTGSLCLAQQDVAAGNRLRGRGGDAPRLISG